MAEQAHLDETSPSYHCGASAPPRDGHPARRTTMPRSPSSAPRALRMDAGQGAPGEGNALAGEPNLGGHGTKACPKTVQGTVASSESVCIAARNTQPPKHRPHGALQRPCASCTAVEMLPLGWDTLVPCQGTWAVRTGIFCCAINFSLEIILCLSFPVASFPSHGAPLLPWL